MCDVFFSSVPSDRVPFVLTSDMAYVINGGERQSSRFQQFVDLCCQAFNILRKNANIFLSLFTLVRCSSFVVCHVYKMSDNLEIRLLCKLIVTSIIGLLQFISYPV